MLFTTLSYFIFFWLVFAGYWSLGKRTHQNILLLISSYVFYSWWDYRFLGLIVASTLIDYFGAIRIDRTDSIKVKKGILAACIGANLSILFVFKYYNFFVDSLKSSLALAGIESGFSGMDIILPLGISFYTFQTISYTVDVYRGQGKACRSFVDYAAYVCFFPQLVAGPIERGKQLIPQFTSERNFSEKESKEGLRLALWGVFKKLVIADNLALFVDAAYGSPENVSGLVLMIATIAFAFQIYCDFSGYSDIAIGCSKLLGFELMRNFAFPYFSQDLGEFWRRWHISLSTWFRDYVFIPLGGGRSSIGGWLRNVLITFVLSGFWHGASLNFIIWGLMNGIGYAIFASQTKRYSSEIPLGEKTIPRLAPVFKSLCVFAFVCLTWVFFRAETFGDAVIVFSNVLNIRFSSFEMGGGGISYGNVFYYIIPFVLLELMTRKHEHPFSALAEFATGFRWGAYIITIFSILYFMPENQAVFVYFQF